MKFLITYYRDADMTQEATQKANYLSLADGEDEATIYVKVTGKGNFTSAYATAAYKVVRNASAVNINKAKITVLDANGNKLQKAEYTGYGLTPQVKVEYKDPTTKTMKILPADQYEIHYQNNINKGKATIVLTGNGTDTVGSKTATFSIASKNLSTVK